MSSSPKGVTFHLAMLTDRQILTAVLLILIANGAPIVARNALSGRYAWPLDFGRDFLDGRAWLGPAKTFRGVIAAMTACAVAAPLAGLPVSIGLLIGLGAMTGDVLSSFVKRRLGIVSSGSAPGLDQGLEAFIPALLLQQYWSLNALDIGVIVILFALSNILLSRLLFRLRIRRHPT